MGLAEELAEGLVDQEFAALVDAVFVVGFEAVTTTQTTMRRSSRSRGSLAKVRTSVPCSTATLSVSSGGRLGEAEAEVGARPRASSAGK